jgi:hypothetical protein
MDGQKSWIFRTQQGVSPEPSESLATHFSDLLVITNEPHISLTEAWIRNNLKLTLILCFDERIMQLWFSL